MLRCQHLLLVPASPLGPALCTGDRGLGCPPELWVLLPLCTPMVPLTGGSGGDSWDLPAGLSLCQEPAQADITSGLLSCVPFQALVSLRRGWVGRRALLSPSTVLVRPLLCSAQGCAGSWLSWLPARPPEGPGGCLSSLLSFQRLQKAACPHLIQIY